MLKTTEQCMCISFCEKMERETYKLVHTMFRGATLRLAFIFEWFCHFQDGQISIKSDKHPGDLSSSRNNELGAQVHELVQNDRRFTICEVANKVDIFCGASKPFN